MSKSEIMTGDIVKCPTNGCPQKMVVQRDPPDREKKRLAYVNCAFCGMTYHFHGVLSGFVHEPLEVQRDRIRKEKMKEKYQITN